MGLSGYGSIIGPNFYKNNLNGAGYLNLLNDMTIQRLQETHVEKINRAWWIQVGAPSHRSVAVRNKLNEVFANRIIALGHQVE
jgi:hypothetical protein